MEPYIGYTYYDYTDISINNINRRTSSIGSNTSEYSFFLSEDEIVNAFDRQSESTISYERFQGCWRNSSLFFWEFNNVRAGSRLQYRWWSI